MHHIYWYIFAILIIYAALEVHITEARRGGGGSRSGGGARRSGSSSSGGRRSGSISTTRYGVRQNYRGPSYSQGSWKTAAAVGTLYGLSSYQRRRRYLDSPDSEPRVCFNEQQLRNGTYGYFICPEEGQDDDMAYCCGDENAQKCCTYTDATAVGRIIGIVVGVLALCGIIGVVVYCGCIKKRMMQRKQPACTTAVGMNGMQNSANPTYNTEYSGFQYDQKQEMSPYPPTADGTNVYTSINDGTPNLGFEDGKQPLPQNGVSAPPPYSSTPYTGFQGMPQPPTYDAGHI